MQQASNYVLCLHLILKAGLKNFFKTFEFALFHILRIQWDLMFLYSTISNSYVTALQLFLRTRSCQKRLWCTFPRAWLVSGSDIVCCKQAICITLTSYSICITWSKDDSLSVRNTHSSSRHLSVVAFHMLASRQRCSPANFWFPLPDCRTVSTVCAHLLTVRLS